MDPRPLPDGWVPFNHQGKLMFLNQHTNTMTEQDPRGPPPAAYSQAAAPPVGYPIMPSAPAPGGYGAPQQHMGYQYPVASAPPQYAPPQQQQYQAAYTVAPQMYPPPQQQQMYPPQRPQQAYPPQQQASSGLLQAMGGDKKRAADQAFRLNDTDMSGFIDPNEFYRALGQLGVQLSWADSNAVFQIIDADSNGAISYQEFVEYYLANY
eukprot:m.354954 g.354954  ORF g.354954 m.354954 type:complete len:208 (-) comp17142_c0_seq1:368-991(-)